MGLEKKNNQNVGTQFIFAAIGLFLIFLLLFSPPPMKFITLIIIVLGCIAFLAFKAIIDRREKKELANSFYGQIEIKRQSIQSSIELYRKELNEIQRSISDLKKKLDLNPNATPEARKESLRIISGFEEEKKLRMTKIGFYELCMTKLNSIIKNHQLAEDLKSNRAKLEKFQENNIEDVAEMESIKTFIDYEKTYLDTIDKLSLKVLESRSIQTAEDLKLELREITKELREI